MAPRPELLPLYLELIEASTLRKQTASRAAFLLLAADAYLASGQEDEGEDLFRDFVTDNPDHLLARHASLTAALNDPEVERYLSDLRRNYPEDVVRELIQETRSRPSLIPRPRQPETTRPLQPETTRPLQPETTRPLQPEPIRPLPPETTQPEVPIPVTQPVPRVRQNNPPNRGPGNPVPQPRPQPNAPPRRDPVPVPTPVPVRPQPATVPSPRPTTPGQRASAPTPEAEGPAFPFVQMLLLIVLLGAGACLVGWTLVRPFFR